MIGRLGSLHSDLFAPKERLIAGRFRIFTPVRRHIVTGSEAEVSIILFQRSQVLSAQTRLARLAVVPELLAEGHDAWVVVDGSDVSSVVQCQSMVRIQLEASLAPAMSDIVLSAVQLSLTEAVR
jgi:hypothetical protein